MQIRFHIAQKISKICEHKYILHLYQPVSNHRSKKQNPQQRACKHMNLVMLLIIILLSVCVYIYMYTYLQVMIRNLLQLADPNEILVTIGSNSFVIDSDVYLVGVGLEYGSNWDIERQHKVKFWVTWKTNNRIHSDFSVFRPNCLRKKFTSVPSFVPVNRPDCGSNLGVSKY